MIDADTFNKAVWSSPDMAVALEKIDEGKASLTHGQGWGLIALDSAINELHQAISAIERLKKTGEKL